MDKLLKVTFFQRRPRAGFSFSLEQIFEDLRIRLREEILAELVVCSHYNDGYKTKILNIIEACKRQSKGINHITGEVHFLNLLMRKKSVVLTVLDCGMVHRKKGLAKFIVESLYLKLPIAKANIVTAISEVTKQEIIRYTKCKPEKIRVIPVAVDEVYLPFTKNFNSNNPNILHIGLGPNKNIYRLIEALQGVNCHLTIIGKLTSEHMGALDKCKVNYSNYYNLSKHDLVVQYQQCDILSFISTFEGFGMPIVEANCVERVVITSNISSMPEIAGNSACLVDPFDIQSIRAGIFKVIEDVEYREMLIENGRTNKLRFEGDAIANEYYKVYQEIALKNGLIA